MGQNPGFCYTLRPTFLKEPPGYLTELMVGCLAVLSYWYWWDVDFFLVVLSGRLGIVTTLSCDVKRDETRLFYLSSKTSVIAILYYVLGIIYIPTKSIMLCQVYYYPLPYYYLAS
jgi:hypothetical protein